MQSALFWGETKCQHKERRVWFNDSSALRGVEALELNSAAPALPLFCIGLEAAGVELWEPGNQIALAALATSRYRGVGTSVST